MRRPIHQRQPLGHAASPALSPQLQARLGVVLRPGHFVHQPVDRGVSALRQGALSLVLVVWPTQGQGGHDSGSFKSVVAPERA